MSPAGQRLRSMVHAAARRVRRDGLVAAACVLGAVLATVLLSAWFVSGVRLWVAPSPAPLVLELFALVGTGTALFIGARWVLGVDERRVAAAAEARRGLPAGSLRGVLELAHGLPAGASSALFRRAELTLESQLADASVLELSGELGELARARRKRALVLFLMLAAVTTALAFSSPERARAAWSPLLNPVAHLTPPPLPALVVEPGDAEVPRGADLEVRVVAPGRREVVLHSRAAGDVPRQRVLAVTGERAVGTLTGIDVPMLYWVTAPDGAASDTFRIVPLDPLLVSDLVVDVVYPAYLERAAERFEGDVPPLEIPAGTQLHIRGRATRRLEDARLVAEEGEAEVRLDVQADRFTGRWTPRASGRYLWALRGAEGEEPVATPAAFDISVVPDAAPEVEITDPGRDTLLGPDLRLPITADAWDDYGLRDAALVSWRVSALGDREPPVEQPLELEGDRTHAAIRAILDASQRRLLPGDTLYYYVRVTDNSPARQTGVSRTYKVRLPSVTELREVVREDAATLVNEASELARSARRLSERSRDLGRRVSASAQSGQQGRGSAEQRGRPGERRSDGREVEYRQVQEAQQLLDRHEEMLAQVEELRERVAELERAMEAAGLRDPELQERLRELRQLYDQILTPELKEQLAELRQALNELDPEQMQRALEQLAQHQEQFRQQLEQSLELLRRAAAEQQMNALADQAQELARQQEALSEAMKRESAEAARSGQQISPEQAARRAEQQQALAERAQSLQQQLQQLQQQLQQMGETQAAEQTGEAAQQMQQALQAMQQAAQRMGQRQGEQAGRAGEEAAQQAQQAAQTLQSARQGMAQAWKQETQQAVQRATQDALSLAQRQNALAQRMQQAQQQGGQLSQAEMQAMRSEQAALQQGLQALGRNLTEASQRSAMINREVGAALGRANLSMQQTLDALEGKDGARRIPAEEAAQSVEALNRLALALLANGQQIAQSQSGTGVEEALEQLAGLARQQGSLNNQTSSLIPLDLAPQVMSQQLQELARRQQEIAQKLGGMNDMLGGRGDLLGRLDELAREAEELSRELSGGRLNADVLARQERLFHRLLDAGRTLERDEVSDERVAERPSNVTPSTGRPLDTRLVDASQRFPAPDAEQLRMLPPAYRRLVLEYFDRLNRGRSEEPRGERR